MSNQIIGTNGLDYLVGTAGDDVIEGLAGHDSLFGGMGNDIINGGDGNDTLGGGDQSFWPSTLSDDGDDTLDGGIGNDYLLDGGGSTNLLTGGEGNDYFQIYHSGSAGGQSILDGGFGDDTFYYRYTVFQNNMVNYTTGSDTIIASGGIGADTFLLGAVYSATIASGDDADYVEVDLSSQTVSITLGAGQDRFSPVWYTFNGNGSIVVEDFQAGGNGDLVSFDALLERTIGSWTGQNPFAAGNIKLVQSGADTVLQLLTSPGSNPIVIATLRKVVASSLTQDNLGYAPDGSQTAARNFDGDSANNIFYGQGGNDLLHGSAGSDRLSGLAGDDLIYGDDDQDFLNGGFGNDWLDGGNGDDFISDTSGNDSMFGGDGTDHLDANRDYSQNPSTLLMDGGAGGDYISYESFARNADTVTIIGGSGDDSIRVGRTASTIIDAGDGNDDITVELLGGIVAVALGSGTDVLTLTQSVHAQSGVIAPVLVSDFEAGVGGDTLKLDYVMGSRVLNWDGVTNPFFTGHLRLVQQGSDALLQIDRTGGGDNFSTFVQLSAVAATNLTSNQIGWDPGTIGTMGTDGPDTQHGTASRDLLIGAAGDDSFWGGAGRDFVDGGDGIDTLHLQGSRDSYVLAQAHGETCLLGASGGAKFVNIEQIDFGGERVAFADLASKVTPFDGLRYIASYPDLLAAFGNNAQAGLHHFTSSGFSEGRLVSFNPLAYVASWPDLIAAFGTDTQAALTHYVTSGHQEGRIVSFDPLAYIASWPDLIAAFGTDTQAALTHYITSGHQEGRTVSFNPLAYAASYADLAAAFGSDADAAARHFITSGHAEGRVVSFDPLHYGAGYVDLARVFDDNSDALAMHYLNAGIAEGRAADAGFDEVGYLLSNVDLENAGLGADGALHHWLRSGADEGRGGDVMFGREQVDHTLNENASVAAAFEQPNDRDWFRFSAQVGETIDLHYISGSLDGVMELHDSDGHVLATSDIGPGTHEAMLSYQAQSSDLYYLELYASTPSTPGLYNIDLVLT